MWKVIWKPSDAFKDCSAKASSEQGRKRQVNDMHIHRTVTKVKAFASAVALLVLVLRLRKKARLNASATTFGHHSWCIIIRAPLTKLANSLYCTTYRSENLYTGFNCIFLQARCRYSVPNLHQRVNLLKAQRSSSFYVAARKPDSRINLRCINP